MQFRVIFKRNGLILVVKAVGKGDICLSSPYRVNCTSFFFGDAWAAPRWIECLTFTTLKQALDLWKTFARKFVKEIAHFSLLTLWPCFGADQESIVSLFIRLLHSFRYGLWNHVFVSPVWEKSKIFTFIVSTATVGGRQIEVCARIYALRQRETLACQFVQVESCLTG